MTSLASILAMLGGAAEAFSARQGNDLIASLLILVLGFTVIIGLICLLLVVHCLRISRLSKRRTGMAVPEKEREPLFPVPIYAVPPRWLAIKSVNPSIVQAALGLSKAAPCSWEEGLTGVHGKKLFISPPIGGWILVFGSGLPDPADDVDKSFHFITRLSRKIGQVQFFSFNRPLNYHAWVQAENGQIQRAYAWAGKTIWNQGKVTSAEVQLRLRSFDYTEAAPDPAVFGQPNPYALNTERVTLLASRWSVDPSAIDARLLGQSQGITGVMSRSAH